MLNVTVQHSEDMAILRCVGRIVAGDEASILLKAVLSQANSRTVVLDLTRVAAIDGGGMGLLGFLQGWARATEGDLKLMNPTSRVRELLELTNLNSVFEIFSSEEECRVARSPSLPPTTRPFFTASATQMEAGLPSRSNDD